MNGAPRFPHRKFETVSVHGLFERAAEVLQIAVVAVLIGSLSACATYHVGNRSLYRPDIRTVHVPIFQSDSLRRHLGERLTEMVVKKIEDKTPYKVVSSLPADSVLTGRILDDQKYVVAENANDEPRDIELELRLEISWHDHRGDLIAPTYAVRVPGELTKFGQAVHLVPEGGQSVATAQVDALERLAEQIVATMEIAW